MYTNMIWSYHLLVRKGCFYTVFCKGKITTLKYEKQQAGLKSQPNMLGQHPIPTSLGLNNTSSYWSQHWISKFTHWVIFNPAHFRVYLLKMLSFLLPKLLKVWSWVYLGWSLISDLASSTPMLCKSFYTVPPIKTNPVLSSTVGLLNIWALSCKFIIILPKCWT